MANDLVRALLSDHKEQFLKADRRREELAKDAEDALTSLQRVFRRRQADEKRRQALAQSRAKRAKTTTMNDTGKRLTSKTDKPGIAPKRSTRKKSTRRKEDTDAS